jgi:hypothetical protein
MIPLIAAVAIMFSTNAAGPYITLTNVAGPSGFVKLQGPAGNSSAAGVILTVTNTVTNTTATASLSNGTIVVTAPAATTNDFNAIGALSTPTNPLILNIQRPQ